MTSVETTSRMEPQEKRNPACACIEQTSSTTGLSDSTVRYLGCWRRSRFATAHLQADRSIIRFFHGCNAARCTPWDASYIEICKHVTRYALPLGRRLDYNHQQKLQEARWQLGQLS